MLSYIKHLHHDALTTALLAREVNRASEPLNMKIEAQYDNDLTNENNRSQKYERK